MTKDSILYGYLESEKFFSNVTNELRSEFIPKFDRLDKNKSLYKNIEDNESVCVTIRRGDFVSNLRNRAKHYICTPEYFEDAIELMNTMVPNLKYIFFSDDIDWVKANVKIPENSLFEDGTDNVWEKLRLMSSCKHFIISNSSFSWWAQYLSDNPNKKVIAPNKWLKHSFDNKDIFQDNWITIEPRQEVKDKDRE